jgi:hypothetical protein
MRTQIPSGLELCQQPRDGASPPLEMHTHGVDEFRGLSLTHFPARLHTGHRSPACHCEMERDKGAFLQHAGMIGWVPRLGSPGLVAEASG